MGTNGLNLITFLFLMITWIAYAQRDNLPCDPVMVSHIPKRSGDNGYRIRIDRHPTDYVPGQQYRVLLQSTKPVSFRNFFLVATQDGAPSEAAGTFQITDRLKTQLSRTCRHAVTHAITASKTSISVEWTAPPTGSGCVNFRAGVIQKKTVWFAEDGELTLQLCEREMETTGPTPSATPDPHTCCAPPYEEAKYSFTFVSTWTPDTHPNQYPRGRGNHWSDLIGASHSSDYTIWDYGQYASHGVKMIAEWGSPMNLEREIRSEGDHVKTVITSRGLFPAYDNRRNMTAYFKTDARRNLVSFISMMGPSPDWCVGISKENLCTPDCGWEERKEFYLQPWDAGTDSGLIYNSINSPQDPPDPIRPITSSNPDNPRAPFYNVSGAPIPPLATVILERVSVRNRSSTVTDRGTSSPGGSNSGGMPPKKGMMGNNPTMPPKVMPVDPTMPQKVMPVDPTMPRKVMPVDPTMPRKVMPVDPTMLPKEIRVSVLPNVMEIVPEGRRVVDCMMTDWGEWSECSNTCGKGKMLRQRVIKRRDRNGGLECGPKKQRKVCKLGKCMSRDCRMGDWRAWSECSVSCGEGIKFRMRDITRSSRGDGALCEALKEMRVCQAGPCQ